ncbi:hypothetical protein JW859_06070 [bacterium]|nr:hypothetical protein [bacterium]
MGGFRKLVAPENCKWRRMGSAGLSQGDTSYLSVELSGDEFRMAIIDYTDEVLLLAWRGVKALALQDDFCEPDVDRCFSHRNGWVYQLYQDRQIIFQIVYDSCWSTCLKTDPEELE